MQTRFCSTPITRSDWSPTSAPYERRRVMLVATLVAAAVTTLVLVAVVVSRDDDDGTSRPTVPDRDRAPDDASASAARPRRREQLAPGTYFVDEVDGTPTPRIFVTIGAGWSNFVDGRSEHRQRVTPMDV